MAIFFKFFLKFLHGNIFIIIYLQDYIYGIIYFRSQHDFILYNPIIDIINIKKLFK